MDEQGTNPSDKPESSTELRRLEHNWYCSTSTGERDEYIEGIFHCLFSEFVKIFGEDVMSHKPVTIFNDPDAHTPRTIPLGEEIRIRLRLPKTSYWAKMIFQLSHEMTHYAFFSYFPHANQENFKKNFENETSSWNEEIICEAMSLYMLKLAAENWEKCSLVQINPKYNAAIENYLKDEYNRSKKFPLKSEGSYIPATDFHKNFNQKSCVDRDNHNSETNYLYDLFTSVNAKTIGEVLDMYKYFNKDHRCIDYAAWIKNANNPVFIENVSVIQPKLT